MSHVFEELRGRGEKAVHGGQLEAAETFFSQALDWAREHGEPWQIDLGTCISRARNLS